MINSANPSGSSSYSACISGVLWPLHVEKPSYRLPEFKFYSSSSCWREPLQVSQGACYLRPQALRSTCNTTVLHNPVPENACHLKSARCLSRGHQTGVSENGTLSKLGPKIFGNAQSLSLSSTYTLLPYSSSQHTWHKPSLKISFLAAAHLSFDDFLHPGTPSPR